MASESASSGGALSGVRVIDLSEGVAGPFASRLLGDLGADVLKVERPEGDRARGLWPQDDGRGKDSLFEYLNWNKRGLVLDIEGAAGRQRLLDLVREADVLIESGAPGSMATLGLDYDSLARVNPGLVMTSVTSFGATGPRSGWKSDEIVDWAVSGFHYFGGHPEREPLQVPGYQAEFHGAQAAALATLAALRFRDVTGEGQWVDQSVQEAALATHGWLTVAWSHMGEVLTRQGPDMMECRDGWVMWLKRAQEPSVFVLIEKPELIAEFEDLDAAAWRDPACPIWEYVREWCLQQSAQDVYHRAQELRIAVTPVNTVADLLSSTQMAERDWFVQVPEGGSSRHAGFPFRLQHQPMSLRRPAPALGAKDFEWEPREDAPPPESVGTVAHADGPLAGLRVVEVTANWAGPLAGRHFGDLGAEVIKVEHSKRPATRASWFPGNEPAYYSFNRSGYFNNLNRSKLDVSLDLASEEGREVFLKLIERADILIENNSARVMPNLRLGYDTLKEVNPGLIMASVSGFGATGPEQHYVAYGANIEASSGLASVMGYRDEDRPYRAGTFYADPIAANYLVIAILSALRARRSTGLGQWIDLSLNEAAAGFFGGYFVGYQRCGELEQHHGNRHQVFAPQGCYRTIGVDAWVALSVRNEDEWRALATLVDRPEWTVEPQFQTAEGRRAAHDEIDEGIAAWTAGRDHNAAARELQAVGVPAAPVMANWEILSDPHLNEREFYVRINHPEVGVFPFPGPAWKLSKTPGKVRRPAPLFAEHNHLILGEIVGLDPARIQALEESGVASPHPDAIHYAARPR